MSEPKYKLVPVEPTDEMRKAFTEAYTKANLFRAGSPVVEGYQAMLAAAPSIPKDTWNAYGNSGMRHPETCDLGGGETDCAPSPPIDPMEVIRVAREALSRLYEETADYIRINNLGDVHQNKSMRDARDALRQIKELMGEK